MIGSEIKTDVLHREYTEYTIPTDYGEIKFSTVNEEHPDDQGYVLFDIIVKRGEPVVNMETYFGMKREQVREFANKLLEIIETPSEE